MPVGHAVHLVSHGDGLFLFGTEGEVDEQTVNRRVSHLDHALQTASTVQVVFTDWPGVNVVGEVASAVQPLGTVRLTEASESTTGLPSLV